MYVYIQSEPGLYTVGFYRPNGKWEPESDHDSIAKAEKITEDNEDIYIGAVREYYRNNFKNGVSDESFLLWIEGKLSPTNQEDSDDDEQ
jgi:hypothetical protein